MDEESNLKKKTLFHIQIYQRDNDASFDGTYTCKEDLGFQELSKVIRYDFNSIVRKLGKDEYLQIQRRDFIEDG